MSVRTLDRPFTVSNIPVSQTDPGQTALAIEDFFEQAVDSYSTGVAPLLFPPPQQVGDYEAPYTAPVASIANANETPQPTTGFNPSLFVDTRVDADGSESFTQFNITFQGTSSYLDEAPLVVTAAATTAFPSNRHNTRRSAS